MLSLIIHDGVCYSGDFVGTITLFTDYIDHKPTIAIETYMLDEYFDYKKEREKYYDSNYKLKSRSFDIDTFKDDISTINVFICNDEKIHGDLFPYLKTRFRSFFIGNTFDTQLVRDEIYSYYRGKGNIEDFGKFVKWVSEGSCEEQK